MSDDAYERGYAEWKRWSDVQFAARDAFREGVSADDIRALISSHREDARREIAELDSIFELGEDEQG